jgi:hypothetical protein
MGSSAKSVIRSRREQVVLSVLKETVRALREIGPVADVAQQLRRSRSHQRILLICSVSIATRSEKEGREHAHEKHP